MSASRYTVGLVVDPEFGDRLAPLASRLHAWVAATPSNRAVVERVRAADPEYGLERGVTVFGVDETAGPEQWCAAILRAIDDHHGPYAHDPPYDAIEVHGVAPTATLRATFAEWDLPEIEAFPGGFRASSRPAG